jgi:hypothetical protein
LGYYTRVLGKTVDNVPLDKLRETARPAILNVSRGDDTAWTELTLRHPTGKEMALVEKNPVVQGELGADELQEFMDEVTHYKPDSAAIWLQQYLPTVKVIYAFQLLGGTDVDDGQDHLHRVYTTIWNHVGGILQADGEGFSDEDGFTILWQFDEKVSGPWKMGILREGSWVHFEMDLGNDRHRESFRRGEIPLGIKLV